MKSKKTKIKQTAQAVETDDLLAALEEKDATKEGAAIPQGIDTVTTSYRNDTLSFLTTFNIVPGKSKVRKTTLFTIYKVWSDDPVTRNLFIRELSQFLQTSSDKKCFKINQTALKLTHEAYKYYSNEGVREKSKTWDKHFQRYVDFYQMKRGHYWIHCEILLDLYKKYCKQHNLNLYHSQHLGEDSFFNYCNKTFEQRQTYKGKFYGVSDNLNIIIEQNEEYKERQQYNRKKRQKKSEQAPESQKESESKKKA